MNKYNNLGNGTTEIIITGNKIDGTILVDTADVSILKKHSWYIKECHTTEKGYPAAKINNKTVRMHKFLTNTDKNTLVDHINRDTHDNRRSNLRVATRSENNLNFKKRSTNTSGRTGVYLKNEQIVKNKDGSTRTKSAKWFAQVAVNGKKKTKSFSIEKYGYDNAYNMAVEQREKWEEEYNILTEK